MFRSLSLTPHVCLCIWHCVVCNTEGVSIFARISQTFTHVNASGSVDHSALMPIHSTDPSEAHSESPNGQRQLHFHNARFTYLADVESKQGAGALVITLYSHGTHTPNARQRVGSLRVDLRDLYLHHCTGCQSTARDSAPALRGWFSVDMERAMDNGGNLHRGQVYLELLTSPRDVCTRGNTSALLPDPITTQKVRGKRGL